MADHAFAFHADAQQHGVAVAVGRGRDDLQAVAAGLAFYPKALSGTAGESGGSASDGPLVGLAVHEAEHEDLPAGFVLHDRRRQPLHLVEVDGGHLRFLSPKTRNPLRFRVSGFETLSVLSRLGPHLR